MYTSKDCHDKLQEFLVFIRWSELFEDFFWKMISVYVPRFEKKMREVTVTYFEFLLILFHQHDSTKKIDTVD